MAFHHALLLLFSLHHTLAQNATNSTGAQPPGVTLPLARTCGPTTADIVCMTRYASVMPYHFYRAPSHGSTDTSFGDTNVPSDPSFELVGDADFLVFDETRAFEVLGEAPTYDLLFNLSDAVHEAPASQILENRFFSGQVYVPYLNVLFFSQLAPPTGFLPQLLLDLNNDPPTLSRFLSDPPVYAPNGGTYHNELVYWGASGGIDNIGGTEQRPGIRTLDPRTNETVTLLNNYYGYYFNTIDDLVVDSTGAIWFTDPQYSWFNRLTDTPPELQSASYRFDPATGAVNVVSTDLVQPNGIALSPDGLNVYISDTGAVTGSILAGGPPGSPFNKTGPRAIYKYDLSDGGTHLINKRPIWYAQDWVPDGLKVASNGYVLTGAGPGIDVLDPYGVLILRVQTDFVVQNFAWVGPDLTELWLMGNGGLARVRWNLAGQVLT